MTILRSLTFSLLALTSIIQASSNNVKEVTSESDLKPSGYAIVKFYAEWCGPCQMFKSDFEKLAKEFSDKAKFYAVNVDKQEAIAGKYRISSLPTVAILLDGKEVKKINRDLLRSELEALQASNKIDSEKEKIKRSKTTNPKKTKKQKKSCK